MPSERLDRHGQVASFSHDAGIERQNVFNFDFEKDGKIWVAASGGLYSYDGYTWHRYGLDQGLPSQFVRSVLVDKDGKLWVGTDQGAGTYDGTHFDSHGSEKGLAGPSVRRITQDPDGTLWFCSDHWPIAVVRAGLTSYKEGVWKAYHESDGLPEEHLYAYFRDSQGHQFALTRGGVRQKNGEHWDPPVQDVGLENAECWSIAETPGMGVVTRDNHNLYILKDGKWSSRPAEQALKTPVAPPLCATRKGEMLTVEADEGSFRVRLFEGGDRTSVSPALDPSNLGLEHLAEAPDGAIWYCAFGVLSRWERGTTEWSEYDDLPYPQLNDREGRVWFSDERGAFRWDGSRFERMPGLAGTLAMDPAQTIWAWLGAGELTSFDGEVHRFSEDQTGLHRVAGHTLDAQGRSWFYGEDAQGRAVAVIFNGKTWTPVELYNAVTAPVLESSPDPVSGVWFLSAEPGERLLAATHFDPTNKEKLTVECMGILHITPHITVDSTGDLWLSGYAGMYHKSRYGDKPWERVNSIPGGEVGRGVLRGDEVWFPFHGWTGGHSGYASHSHGVWRNFDADYSDLLTVFPDGMLYVGTDQGLQILAPGKESRPSELTLPNRQRVHTLVKDMNGDLWMGVVQPNGQQPSVLRYRVDHARPRGELGFTPREIRAGQKLLLSIAGRERYVQGKLHTFRFSWRFDRGPWTPFQPIPAEGLDTTGLSVGPHTLEVHTQDEGLDVDETPVVHRFHVSAIPLQERAWFRPAVVGCFGLIVLLGLTATERARRFARANRQLETEIRDRRKAEQAVRDSEAALKAMNDRLEERVVERTSELSEAITHLNAEVAERKRIQAEIEEMHTRLLETSRHAGMAEVATNVLHNVGNVLNSVNVSATVLADSVRQSESRKLDLVCALLREHENDLPQFLAEDAKGKQLPRYLETLNATVNAERNRVHQEVEVLRKNVEHIKEIVSMQQNYAKISGVAERVPIVELVDDALRMNTAALGRHEVALLRDFRANPVITVDKHKVLQILVNLIRNAKYACDESGRKDKVITVTIDQIEDRVRIAVIDNGVGIPAENLTRIFAHGFTTRKNGHGFGLHSGALAAKEMGGALTVRSEGPLRGATFVLELPLERPSRAA